MGEKTKKLLWGIAAFSILSGIAILLYALFAHPIPSPSTGSSGASTDTRPDASAVQPQSQTTTPSSDTHPYTEDNSLHTTDISSPEMTASHSTSKPSNITAATEKPSTVTLETQEGPATYPNYEYHALYTPSDARGQWHTDYIGAPAAWSKTTGTADTIVAVIDTGFALEHDELFNRWAINPDEQQNNTDSDNNGLVDDWRGWDFYHNDNDPSTGTAHPTHARVTHGTGVAGLIGAAGNNSLGSAGVNWHTQILPLQALNDNGVGYTSDITAAIDYAISREVDVINLSLGGENHDPVLEAAIDRALAANILVVAASGNDGCNCLSYPARYPQVLSVGATTQNNTVASFSSYGDNLDIVAPGALISRSTSWTTNNQQSAYRTNISGTSYAAPIVSGAAALLKSTNPTLTATQLAEALTHHASVPAALAASGSPLTYGAGILNLTASLHAVAPSLPTNTPAAYTPLYQLTRAGRPTEYTALRDRVEELRAQGYRHEILRFITL